MWKRTSNPDDPIYGGVEVDPRWRDYMTFLADMGVRPYGTTIDRIDGTKGYWPWNCRWATAKEQCTNKKKRSPLKVKRKAVDLVARYGLASDNVDALI